MTSLVLKSRIRQERLDSRRAVADEVRNAETLALCGHVHAVVERTDAVAGYAPIRGEPGFPGFADALLAACVRVLLPVARAAADGTPLPLQWAEYHPDELVDAPFGLREPSGPWLPPTALAGVRTIFVPALAVDRHGIRLGRGAGFYDRSLHFRDPAARLIAVVRDDELVEALPAEPHDVAMTHALTPGRGLVTLSSRSGGNSGWPVGT